MFVLYSHERFVASLGLGCDLFETLGHYVRDRQFAYVVEKSGGKCERPFVLGERDVGDTFGATCGCKCM